MTKTELLTTTTAPMSLAAAIAAGPRPMDPVERIARAVRMEILRDRMAELAAK